MSGTCSRQLRMRCSTLASLAGRRIARSTFGLGMLERDVEIGEDQPLGHQRDDLVDVRIGIDVVEPHPAGSPSLPSSRARSVMWARTSLALPRPRLVADVDAIGRRVLADDQQFLGAGGDQLLGLAQDRVGAAADEVAAQMRDDAEGAAVIAALGNLQIAVVARRQLEPGFGHQVDERRWDRRRGLVDRGDDLLILLRPGDREHVAGSARGSPRLPCPCSR